MLGKTSSACPGCMITASGEFPHGAEQLSDLIACSNEPWQLLVAIAYSNAL